MNKLKQEIFGAYMQKTLKTLLRDIKQYVHK